MRAITRDVTVTRHRPHAFRYKKPVFSAVQTHTPTASRIEFSWLQKTSFQSVCIPMRLEQIYSYT